MFVIICLLSVLVHLVICISHSNDHKHSSGDNSFEFNALSEKIIKFGSVRFPDNNKSIIISFQIQTNWTEDFCIFSVVDVNDQSHTSLSLCSMNHMVSLCTGNYIILLFIQA